MHVIGGVKMNLLRKFIQHNWLAIVYLNFRMLPLRQAIHLPLDVYNKIRFLNLKGRIILDTPTCWRGMVTMGTQGGELFSEKNETILDIRGDLIIKGRFTSGIGTCIRVDDNASLIMGNDVIVGGLNLLFCSKKIELDSGFLSSWKCQIMDTDTHPIIDMLSRQEKPYIAPVHIGEHTWLCNGVTVNKGTQIPANTIVASHSLCNRDYTSEGSCCVLAGVPAKVVARDKDWRI